MKKLIDELETLKNEYNSDKTISTTDNDIRFGIERAIEIVRAHNPWHEVWELPPMRKYSNLLSIKVIVRNSTAVSTGVYDREDRGWNSDIGGITHWAYLPEAKP